MYSKLYNSFLEILKTGHSEDYEHMNPNNYPLLSNLLNITFGFDMEGFHRILKINKKGMLPTIYLVLADPDNNGITNNKQYIDYLYLDNELCAVVLLNFSMLIDDNEENQIAGILLALKELLTIPMTSSLNINTNNIASNIMYYAPMILSIKLIRRLYTTHDNLLNILLKSVLNLYNDNSNKINHNTIVSAIKIIDELSIEVLLDNSYLIAVNNENYPNLLFLNNNSDESISENQNSRRLNYDDKRIQYSYMDINSEFYGLYTDSRINKDSLPDDLYMYELRHDDYGVLCTIEHNVAVDFYGTFITNKEINTFDNDSSINVDYINIEQDTTEIFTENIDYKYNDINSIIEKFAHKRIDEKVFNLIKINEILVGYALNINEAKKYIPEEKYRNCDIYYLYGKDDDNDKYTENLENINQENLNKFKYKYLNLSNTISNKYIDTGTNTGMIIVPKSDDDFASFKENTIIKSIEIIHGDKLYNYQKIIKLISDKNI